MATKTDREIMTRLMASPAAQAIAKEVNADELARRKAARDRIAAGKATLGVVFDPSKPASVAEKNALMAALGSGYAAGTLTLVGKAIEADAVGGAAGVQALFVTGGVNYGAVGSAAKGKKLITIGSDMACVRSGACAMGVETEPKVSITVNRAAAAAVGASFKAAFRMMITEI